MSSSLLHDTHIKLKSLIFRTGRNFCTPNTTPEGGAGRVFVVVVPLFFIYTDGKERLRFFFFFSLFFLLLASFLICDRFTYETKCCCVVLYSPPTLPKCSKHTHTHKLPTATLPCNGGVSPKLNCPSENLTK